MMQPMGNAVHCELCYPSLEHLNVAFTAVSINDGSWSRLSINYKVWGLSENSHVFLTLSGIFRTTTLFRLCIGCVKPLKR